jgi:orotidine-5'-phosphate decarboxylase
VSDTAVVQGGFFSLVSAAIKNTNSLLCVGLDPEPTRLPGEVLGDVQPTDAVVRFLKEVVQITASRAAAYKLNKAFFDPLPNGLVALAEVCNAIRTLEPRRPIIIDCKVGDTPNTMIKYEQMLFGTIGADAIIVNPYLGPDVWRTSADARGLSRAYGVLVRTSNPGAHTFQDLTLGDNRTLWQAVLDVVVADREHVLFPVVSFDREEDARLVRDHVPPGMPIFFAGVGAQAKDPRVLAWLLDTRERSVLVGSSRAILYPEKRDTETWQGAIQRATDVLWHTLDEQRRGAL